MNFYRKNHLHSRWNFKSGLSRIARLIMFLVMFQVVTEIQLFGQNSERVVVIGTVKDEKNESLPGVNITSRQISGHGTISNIDGNFSIVVAPDDVLRFSFIGFATQEIPVDGRATIHVVMNQDVTSLDEVVLIGYGTARRANVVGNIATLDVEQIVDLPTTNLISLLDGQMPGVSVSPSQPTGRPGAATRVVIHGQRSFGTAGGGIKDPSPLFVIDGFTSTQEHFEMLDPSQIEYFSVLKDAAAAVYGADGANGVIIVQTKRGHDGPIRVNYTGSYGISDATQQTEMLSAYDHARILNQMDMMNPDPDFARFTDEDLLSMRNLDYNWLDDAWKSAAISRHSINLSGGSDRARYFGGGTYVHETGNFDQLSVTNYSYRLGADINITRNLSASTTISIENREMKIPYTQSVGSNTMQNTFETLLLAPKWQPHHINGLPVYPPTLRDNPFAFFDTDSYNFNQSKGNTLNLALNYQFERIPGLEANVNYSRRESHRYTKRYSVPYTLYEFVPAEGSSYLLTEEVLRERVINNRNEIFEAYSYGKSYQVNASLSYNRDFGSHNIRVFGSYEQRENEGLGFDATSYTRQLLGVQTQQAFNFNEARARGSLNEGGEYSGIARLNYSYDTRYVLESTFRVQTSTNFAPGERTGMFPMVGFAWNVSEERFFRDAVGFVDHLKLRGAAGRTGINTLGAYEYRLEYGIASGSYLFGDAAMGGLSARNDGAVSTGVSWEKSDMYNAGLDIHLLRSRLSLSLDAFYRYNFDILEQRTIELPQTTGIHRMPSENNGRLEGWGYDMQIEWKDNITRDLSWFVKGIFQFNTNRVLERFHQYSPLDFRYPIGRSTYAEGADQGFLVNGIIRTEEQLNAINEANREQFGYDLTYNGQPLQVGMLYFQDIGRPGNINEGEPPIVYEPDGRITDADITYIQRVNENLEWKNLLPTSASLGAKWKSLSISMLFQMRYGLTSKQVDQLARTAPTLQTNAPAFWSDFYNEDNINSKYPSPVFNSMNRSHSTFWIRDEVLLRMRTINVSYSLPTQLVNGWGLSAVRIYFSGENLWTPISTFDYKEDAIARFNTYPFLKKYNFGLNLSL